MKSACGRDGGGGCFAPGEFLLQRCKRNQKTAGGGSRAFTMPYPASPEPPLFLRGSHQRAKLYPSGAGKRQDTVPCAARCRSVLVEQVYAPTRAIAPGFPPSRGGSVVAPPPGLVLDGQDCREHAPALGPQPLALRQPQDHSGAGVFRSLPTPRGYIQ